MCGGTRWVCPRRVLTDLLVSGDGVEFLSWFLNALHSALGGTKRKKKSERRAMKAPIPLGHPLR